MFLAVCVFLAVKFCKIPNPTAEPGNDVSLYKRCRKPEISSNVSEAGQPCADLLLRRLKVGIWFG